MRALLSCYFASSFDYLVFDFLGVRVGDVVDKELHALKEFYLSRRLNLVSDALASAAGRLYVLLVHFHIFEF